MKKSWYHYFLSNSNNLVTKCRNRRCQNSLSTPESNTALISPSNQTCAVVNQLYYPANYVKIVFFKKKATQNCAELAPEHFHDKTFYIVFVGVNIYPLC